MARALGQIQLGADYRSGVPTRPSYDPDSSMSTMAAFPWVYAAMMRASGDLAGLPLRAYQTRRGNTVELDPTHPVLRILRRPHPRWTGRQLRRQLYVDLRLTGNAFSSRLGVGQASILLRLHPRRVEISAHSTDGYGSYIYNGTGVRQVIPPDQIFHIRAPSWQDDPRGLWGTGAIESLHHDLTTDRRAAQAASVLAKRPRPDIVVSPASEGEILTKEVREEIGKQLDRLLGDGGTLVLPSALKLDLPSWTPRDMEFPALRTLVREAVLAVTGVPPHLVGLPVANYAQSREQTLVYWELQQGIAADIEDAFFNPLAEQFGEGIYVVHDFSRVDALQEARTGRLQRVQMWWSMSADPAVAARYEGFNDLPDELFAVVEEPSPPAETDPSQDAGKAKAAPTGETERAAVWRSWLERAHAPAERRLSGVLSSFLRSQAQRIAKAAAAVDTRAMRRDLIDAILDLIWDDVAERLALQAAVKGHVRELVAQSWRSTVNQMGLSLPWDPTRANPAIDGQIGNLIVQVNATTKASVRQIVIDAIASGETTADMQARIQSAAAFAPSRALAVARTEATRSVNAGQLVAYQQAEAEGVTVRKQWLSARDSNVRDAHAMLDGQERAPGEDFIIPAGSDFAGEAAPGPGQFTEAALCVNCRCTTVPIITEE